MLYVVGRHGVSLAITPSPDMHPFIEEAKIDLYNRVEAWEISVLSPNQLVRRNIEKYFSGSMCRSLSVNTDVLVSHIKADFRSKRVAEMEIMF